MKITEHSEPFHLFDSWLKKALAEKSLKEPTAMNLATVDENGKPSSRMILLKKFDENGFCFFTNLTSRKAKALAANPDVALCFYWMPLGLQVRIEGRVEKVTGKEADDYFSSRRRESQIGAWASKQSSEMENEQEFTDRLAQIEKDFSNQDIPRPPFWSGFRTVPNRIEFWEEGDFRLHKRTVYSKASNGWTVTRIYP